MQTAEKELVTLFEQAARKDESLLNKLKKEQHFVINQYQWRFTLPNLFSYLQNQDLIFNKLEYKQFRQLIFNSPINQTVKLYGAEIIISDNSKKVDESQYSLVWKK